MRVESVGLLSDHETCRFVVTDDKNNVHWVDINRSVIDHGNALNELNLCLREMGLDPLEKLP